MSLNNNQAKTIVNEAIAQSTGSKVIATLDLQEIVDNGNDSTIVGSKESFTKSLINVISKNWFEDSSYRSEYSDIFFEDSAKMGALTQMVSVESPEAQESHAWKDFSPVTLEGNTTYAEAGVYKLYLPVVHSQVYGKSISWELPIAITDEQWDTAFTSVDELKQFVNYVFMVVDNAIVMHLENMNNSNRNAFIAEKFLAQESLEVKGIHAVNLIAEYQSTLETKSNMTVEQFLNSDDALQWCSEYMKNMITLLKKPTRLFNTAGRLRFIPNNRLVFQLNSLFKNRVERKAYTNAFNEEFVKLPLHDVVPFWQAVGNGATWEECTSIDVKVTSNNAPVKKANIVGLLADKWAIVHTIKNHRVAVTRFDPEAVTQYYNQFRDSYMNNLTMNAIVLYLSDYTV